MSGSIGLLGAPERLREFPARTGLELRDHLETFVEQLPPTKAGIAEVAIRPGSALIGKTARGIAMRKTYGLSLSALHRDGKTLGLGEGSRDMPLQAGDALVVHTSWDALARLEKDRNFVVVTTEYPHEELRPHKVRAALGFFALTLGLILLTDTRLSLALMTGAIGMILAGVLKIQEAYHAVSWKSVFLLASLIPLGLAVETSGTAAWIAQQTLALLGGTPIWVVQLAIVILATCFTLVMSNVGATVLLVPLAVNIAIGAGADPAVFALTVALATSNSFFLPTHQVNALIMGPAGYRVADLNRLHGGERPALRLAPWLGAQLLDCVVAGFVMDSPWPEVRTVRRASIPGFPGAGSYLAGYSVRWRNQAPVMCWRRTGPKVCTGRERRMGLRQ